MTYLFFNRSTWRPCQSKNLVFYCICCQHKNIVFNYFFILWTIVQGFRCQHKHLVFYDFFILWTGVHGVCCQHKNRGCCQTTAARVHYAKYYVSNNKKFWGKIVVLITLFIIQEPGRNNKEVQTRVSQSIKRNLSAKQ